MPILSIYLLWPYASNKASKGQTITYIYFAAAIVSEVVATSALKASEQFTKLTPSLIVIIGYCISFYLVTLVLKTIPVGITYAIWSGVGIVLVALVGAILYKQIPDIPAVIGMGFIIAGVVIINVYSMAPPSANSLMPLSK